MGKKGNKQDVTFLKLLLSLILSVAYFVIIFLLTKGVYTDCLYFRPSIFVVLLIVNSTIIFVVTLLTKKYNLKRLLVSVKNRIIVFIVTVVILVFPILFFKCGTIADDISIQKKNIFGKTTQILYYNDIKSIDVSVKYGIQYEIEFVSGDEILLFSDELIYIENFRNDENLMQFDKIISQYAEKVVTDDATWISPWNTRRFFENEEVFNYFDEFFSQYY